MMRTSHGTAQGTVREMLRRMWGDPQNLAALEDATEARWGGLEQFGRDYEAGKAEFSDLCSQEEGADPLDLGFAWGLLTATANLCDIDMGTMCQLAAESLEVEA